MPTFLGRPYSIDWRGDPPHMLKEDVPVWYDFLDRYGYMFHFLYYDCLLGGPEYTEEQLKDPIIHMWRQNLSKRADAIAELETEVWIIEVADNPGLRAVGQLNTYRALWMEDPKIMKPEKPVLVCRTIDTDLAKSLSLYGGQIYVV
jgi:hypothetical protein